MAVGKNKRLSKGKKGKGKKVIDPFTKKEWYDIKAPSNFSVRACGKTPVTRTTGTKIASEMLKGRVFEICLADLNKDEDQAYRKIKLQCEEVQGKYCLTQFYGLDFTTDKIRSMVRKWQSLIEAFVDVKTTVRPLSPRPRRPLGRARRRAAAAAARRRLPPRVPCAHLSPLAPPPSQDGYVMRLFAIGFTKKRQNQLKKTCYASAAQQKLIRKKMREIMQVRSSPHTTRPAHPPSPLADSPLPPSSLPPRSARRRRSPSASSSTSSSPR